MASPSVTGATAASSVTPSCTGNTCQNVVRFVKLYISQSNTISTEYSYAVIGDIDGVEDGGYISVEYNYEYMGTGRNFAKVSNIGY